MNPKKRYLWKKWKRVGSKGSQLRNKSGWGGAGGRAQRFPPQCLPPQSVTWSWYISQCRWALSSTFVALSQHTADYSGSSSTVTLNVAVGGPYHPPFCGNKGLARASLRALPGLWPAHTFPGTGHVVLACCLVECSSTMCHNTCKCVSPILQKTNKFK